MHRFYLLELLALPVFAQHNYWLVRLLLKTSPTSKKKKINLELARKTLSWLACFYSDGQTDRLHGRGKMSVTLPSTGSFEL